MVCTTAHSTFLVAFLLALNHSAGWILPKKELLAWVGRNSAVSVQPSKGKYFIPAEQIEELREVVDIVSVIESFNLPQFKRNGDRATCLCPFHDDHNPSMNIDANKGIYKCFSCGAGGNVYNFIQEYSKLEGEEISFPRAVQIIKENFASDVGPSLEFNSILNDSGDSEYDRMKQAKKERLVQVNLEAASYFEKNLVSMAGAGKARAYLRDRKLNPTTIRAFSIGYAPDCYFEPKGDVSRRWGEGSLVSYLREQNFTAQEIFDAGLAIQTKANSKTTNNSAPTKQKGTKHIIARLSFKIDSVLKENVEVIHYSNIMDRFRDRIMVPIFDSTGKSVIGFGGRILDRIETKADIRAPKYINSPESLIFKKQEVLFGQHMAKNSVRFWASKADDENHPVLIVEGYMDVVALWQVGIRESVASMGTSLTAKQLNSVAAIAGRKNGHVVLCLDNDDAGLSAIERLCSGKVLHDLTERYPLEIRVASLPAGVKDPAEFIEYFAADENVVEAFRTEIIAGALEWSDWYIKRVLTSYNPESSRGTAGSIGDIFERVATFLSNYQNPADRTKQAYEVAGHLGRVIANKTQVSNAVILQLESDLIEKAASIAQSRAAISSRQTLSRVGSSTLETELFDASSEYEYLGAAERNKLSSKALRQSRETNKGRVDQFGASSIQKGDERRSLSNGSRHKIQRASRNVPDFTPHFKGFDFLDENDEKWLGMTDERGRKINYLLPKGTFNKFGEINEFGQKKPIYFNSNEYHGDQFLTEEAMRAGYKSENVRRDPELFRKGIASLLERDPFKSCLDAEDSLLHMLVLYSPAREAVKTILNVGHEAKSMENVPLQWSSKAKQWLFRVLVEKESSIPRHINGPADKGDLYKYLKQCIEAPAADPGSLIESTKGFEFEQTELNREEVSNTSASMNKRVLSIEVTTQSENPKVEEIDFIFDPKFDPPGEFATFSIDDFEILQLSTQQFYSSLLLASARLQLSCLQENLTTAVNAFQQAVNKTKVSEEDVNFLLSETNTTGAADGCKENVNRSSGGNGTKEGCDMLASKIAHATQAINRIAESNSRLSQRLTDLVLSRQIRTGEISRSDYENLKRRLDEHMLELTQSVQDVSDESDAGEAYEDVLECAQLDWGKLYDDEYMWSPKDARQVPTMKNPDSINLQESSMEYSEPVEESLADFNARMEKSWGWLDNSNDPGADDLGDETSFYTFDQGKWDDLLLDHDHSEP